MALSPSNGKTVLVTGINGYIAGVLGLLLLSKGYSLRGTARSVQRAEPLLHDAYKLYADAGRVQIVEVSDMTADGAFDDAVKGVHGIFHTASPLNFSHSTYEQTVVPAATGTRVLLNSALKAGSQLSAVVVTSSVITVFDRELAKPGHVFTEKDVAWSALEQAQAEKTLPAGTTPSTTLYAASKIAAEKEVWKFQNSVKPSFHISAINPAVVIGPPVQTPSSPESLNQTLKPIWDIFTGASIGTAIGSGTFVDVRDVAYMHLWSFEHSSVTNGQRYLAVSGFAPTQAIADSLREEYPERQNIIPKGNPGHGYEGFIDGIVKYVGYPPEHVQVSGEKASTVMGVEFIPFKQSVLDTVERFTPWL